MLCPSCGTDVGDKPVLCARCEASQNESQKQQEAEEHDAENAEGSGEPQPAPNMKPAWILFGAGGALVFLGLVWGLFAGKPAPAPGTGGTAEQAELTNLYNHCILIGKEVLKMGEDISKKSPGGMGPFETMMRSYFAQSGTIEKGCEARRRICELDFNGDNCKRERESAALFYAFHLVCAGEDFKAMSSPQCQELFKTCVAGTLEAAECRDLLKRLGAIQ